VTAPFLLEQDVVEYVQRTRWAPVDVARSGAVTAAPPACRRIVRVTGVGVHRKAPEAPAGPRIAAKPLEQVLVGMASASTPVAFQVDSSPGHAQFWLGSWSDPGAPQPGTELLGTLLRGAYPAVELATEDPPPPRPWPRSGLLLGVPAPQPDGTHDRAAPVHRLVRALAGSTWSLLVLAEPVDDALLHDLRADVINDMRLAAAAEAASGAPSPLRAHYTKLLQQRLDAMADGQSMGCWRTAVYLLGDEVSYPALAAAARGVLSGGDGTAEPLRVHADPQVVRWAAQWAMPDDPGPEGPCTFRHPFARQTLLSSRQLAAIVGLPEEEMTGFQVREQPRFDLVPSPAPAGSLTVGAVVDGSTRTSTPYALPARALTRHALVAGTTGSGKTNTVLSLLFALAERGVPFLVMEPAKSEYRSLLAHGGLGDHVQVFTVGAETVSPFRLNPFEVGDGESVAAHLDLLRAAFNASFGMWTPLPQILEQCLHEIYVDAGWDLAGDSNRRLGPDGDRTLAFPTLTDLLAKVPQVVARAGYEERIEADIRAALVTRLRSLRVGGKGAMLDVARSIPMDVLLGRPTVLELEWLGDDDDKALVMGLLLVRIAEHRRARGESAELVHVTVVEEAHRLLSRAEPRLSEESADPRGRAVDTFVNLLAEIRAYGQGIVVADQVPLRLAPEILKNTNLKIAHRTVAADDRAALAGAMAMDEAQSRALTTLPAGRAAVFSGGDDTPLLVDFTDVKDRLAAGRPGNAAVAERMRSWRQATGLDAWLFAQPFCAETCAADLAACRAAQELTADDYLRRTFARTAQSLAEHPPSLDRMWDDLVNTVRTRRPPLVDWNNLLGSILAHATDWYVRRRGAQAGWDFAATAALGNRLRAALLAKRSGEPTLAPRLGYRDLFHRLHARTYVPFPACEVVCAQEPPVCLYRHAAADLAASGRYWGPWVDADATDAAAAEPTRAATWNVCQDAGYELIEFPEPDVPDADRAAVTAAARRASRCFAQHMLAGDQIKTPRTVRRVIDLVIREAAGE
jgi:hypothetical protein